VNNFYEKELSNTENSSVVILNSAFYCAAGKSPPNLSERLECDVTRRFRFVFRPAAADPTLEQYV
jgi:hypothetical protein